MGLVLRDDTEQSDLAARIGREMRSKMAENSADGGEKLEPVENHVENSAYMEEFSQGKKNPYFWRIVTMIAVFVAIILAFVFVM